MMSNGSNARMYVNAIGRKIERVTGVNHNTIINWVRKAGLSLPNAIDTNVRRFYTVATSLSEVLDYPSTA